MEEIIYVLSGRAEQWVDREKRLLTAGQIAHIPKGVVHGTYNAGPETLEFLAILSPAKISGPALVDVKKGQGHVVLYGFRPQYRGQPNATFTLIWGAMQ